MSLSLLVHAPLLITGFGNSSLVSLSPFRGHLQARNASGAMLGASQSCEREKEEKWI
jgi:hypothetical protein